MIGDIKLINPVQIKLNKLKIVVFIFLLREQIHKTASPLWQTGSYSIAVVSAITEAHDAETAILPLQTPFSKKCIDRISPNNISH
jgi:hypothetical protein